MFYKVRAYTGPVAVKEVCERMGQISHASIRNVVAGTEHMYCEAEAMTPEGAVWNAQVEAEKAGMKYLTFNLLSNLPSLED